MVEQGRELSAPRSPATRPRSPGTLSSCSFAPRTRAATRSPAGAPRRIQSRSALVGSSTQPAAELRGFRSPAALPGQGGLPAELSGLCSEKARAAACCRATTDECKRAFCVRDRKLRTMTAAARAGAPYAKNWLGLHIAQDVAFVGGTDICTQDAQRNDNFSCYYAGSRTGAFIDEPYPGTDTSTSPPSQPRDSCSSYDRAFSAARDGRSARGVCVRRWAARRARRRLRQRTTIVRGDRGRTRILPVHARSSRQLLVRAGRARRKRAFALTCTREAVSLRSMPRWMCRAATAACTRSAAATSSQACASGTRFPSDPGLRRRPSSMPGRNSVRASSRSGGGVVYAFTAQARRSAQPEPHVHAARHGLRDRAVARRGDGLLTQDEEEFRHRHRRRTAIGNWNFGLCVMPRARRRRADGG